MVHESFVRSHCL